MTGDFGAQQPGPCLLSTRGAHAAGTGTTASCPRALALLGQQPEYLPARMAPPIVLSESGRDITRRKTPTEPAAAIPHEVTAMGSDHAPRQSQSQKSIRGLGWVLNLNYKPLGRRPPPISLKSGPSIQMKGYLKTCNKTSFSNEGKGREGRYRTPSFLVKQFLAFRFRSGTLVCHPGFSSHPTSRLAAAATETDHLCYQVHIGTQKYGKTKPTKPGRRLKAN